MRRALPAFASIVALLALSLPACGAASPPDRTAADPLATTAGPAQRAGGGVALKQIGRFEQPVYVTGAPGFPKLLWSSSRGG